MEGDEFDQSVPDEEPAPQSDPESDMPAAPAPKAKRKPAVKGAGTRRPPESKTKAPKGSGRTAPVPAPAPVPVPAVRKHGPSRTPQAAAGVKLPKAARKTGDLVGVMRGVAGRLKLAADGVRSSIILLLTEQSRLNVGQICAALNDMSQPAISHHLALLRHGRMIEPSREGKNNFYSLTDEGRALGTLLQQMVA